MTIAYSYKRNLYLNLTNRCPNRCCFCVRNQKKGLGDAKDIWLDKEPTVDEVVEELDRWDMSLYDEIVFCGYGEPTERMDDLLTIADIIHDRYDKRVRLNTNGLCNLINGRDVIPDMKGRIDNVSISINAPNAERYLEICDPKFGIESYDALISFIEGCVGIVPGVTVTTVSGSITDGEEKECAAIAKRLGVRYFSR